MKNLILTLLLGGAMYSCGTKGAGELPVLDVTKSYPAKKLVLQDFAEVEYVPLETKEGFLLEGYIPISYVDDEILVTFNQGQGNIMTFDRKTGKGLVSFNRTGRGPVEYPSINSIAVDMKNNEMFVTPSSISGSGYPIYTYDLQGKPLRALIFNGFTFPRFFHNYDDSHLIFHNTDIAKPEFFSLISKTDTVVTYLPLRFAGRQTMTITRQVNGGSSSISAGSSVAKIHEGYMISEPGLDTMYRWNRNTGALTPVMAQTPSFASMEYPVGMFYMGESADFIFIQTVERKYDFDKGEGFDRMYLLYDKRDGEYYEAIVENDDQTDGRRFFPAASQSGGIPAGQFIYALQPYELLDLHEQGKLRGRLAEIAPTLKEDDNPVMMIVTMK